MTTQPGLPGEQGERMKAGEIEHDGILWEIMFAVAFAGAVIGWLFITGAL
jgi:hypothetical protein